jgi:hypothetical protein
MPANQSSPSAPKGARPDPSATASTRPGSSAPHASACGPPPEWPRTANSPTPSASATAAASAAAEALSRSGRAVELMYPGRSQEIQRMPRSAAAGNSGSGGMPVFGEPWCQKTVRPPASPLS